MKTSTLFVTGLTVFFGLIFSPGHGLALVAGQKSTCENGPKNRVVRLTTEEKIVDLDVGTIIVATGFHVFDAARMTNYSYGKLPGVYNALEV